MPLGLEVSQEVADQLGVEISQIELVGLLAAAILRVAQQQPPGVPIGGDGVGAGLALMREPFGEERFQAGGEGGHDRASACRSRRWAASNSSSGTADKYQMGVII